MNEGEVYFGLFGDDFDPQSISKEIGIEPTRIKVKGDPIPKQSHWILSTGKVKNESVDVYEMASNLITRLIPFKSKIIEVKNKYVIEAVLQVVLTISSDDSISTPAIGFNSDVIEFLDKVGASIDIDTYRD